MLDESLGDRCVYASRLARAIPQNDIVHYAESRDQLGPRPLRHERPGGIGNFHNQQPAGRDVLAQPSNMLSQKWIEVTSQPTSRLDALLLARLFERNDFRSRVQDA